tara:strand:+ start:419 stop:880 length:462 start_codon:yes stop_codon:yes gene_type:complete
MKVTEYKGHKVPFNSTHALDASNFYDMTGTIPKYFDDNDGWIISTAPYDYLESTLIELPEQPTKSDDVIEHDNNNKYSRKIKTIVVDGIDHDIYVDVYDILTAFKTDNPAVDHAVKKELAPGVRGAKGRIQDFMEARDSLNRAIEIEKAKGGE